MATITTENGVTIVTGATAADTGFMQSYNPGSSYFCANGLEVTVSERSDAQAGYTVSWTYEGVAYSKDLTADVVLIGGGWDTEVASASIIINGGTVNEVYGGGVTADADVTGDISVVVNGGNIVHLNGAGGCGSVGGNVNMVVGGEEGGPNISTNIIGGGWFEGADVAGDVTITLKNGQLGTVPGADGYPCQLMSGGGVFADVAGKVTINIEDGNWYAIVAGGAMLSGNVGSTEINMNGGTVTQINGAAADFYANGDIGSVGSAEINVAGGTVLDAVVGGSVYRGEVTDSVEINVTGGVINTLGGTEGIIGGSQMKDITGTTSVNVTTTGENAPVINGSIAKADDLKVDGNDVDMSTIYVGNVKNDFAAGIVLGVNAFVNANDAEAAAEYTASKMVIVEGSDVTYTKDQYYFLNTNPNEGGENNAFDNVVDADKTYDMQVDGTFKAYQVLMNNAVTTVSKTGKLLAAGEALRIMGGSITVEGNRAENAGVPAEIYTGRWGGGVSAGADTQIQGGYFIVNQEAVAKFSDTVMLVHAGFFNVDNATADFSNTYIYMGDGGGYGAVKVSFTNGAEVTLANNTTMVYDKTYTVNPAMNITVDGTSSLTMDSTSKITASTLTVAEGGKLVINASGFTGVKKVIDLDAAESSEGKVTINGEGVSVVYGADGDVTLVNADTSILYVNSEYADLEFGTAIEGKEGVFVGVNAFGDFDSAVAALKDNNTTIALLSNATMSADPSFKLNVISGDGNDYQLKIDSVIDVDAVFAKEITLDAPLFRAYYNNHTIVVNGDLKGGFYNYTGSLTFNNSKITNSYDNSNIGGVVNINGDGSWTMENAQADNLKFINVGRSDWLGQGILNLNDTVVKAIQFSVDSSSANAKSQINAVNSTIATVLNDGMFGNLVVAANGEVNLTNSKLNVAGTLTNNGAVNVVGSNTSTLDFQFADASTVKRVNVLGGGIKDSEFNGNMLVTGNAAVEGENTVDGIAKIVNGAALTVEEEAVLDVKKIAIGEDNYGSLDVGEADSYDKKGGKLVVEGTVTGEGLTVNVDANGTLAVEDGGKLTASQIAVENGGVELTLADMGGKLQVKEGGEVEARFLKVFNHGTVEVEGSVDLTHSDPRQNLLQVMKDGEVNIRSTGDVTIDGHNASVAEGGQLNIYGGKLNVTRWEGRDIGGVLTNQGKVVVTGSDAAEVNIVEVAGNAIELVNGGLVDSNIGGTVMAYGENNISGETTVSSLRMGYKADKADNAKVNITGAYNGNFIVGWEDGNADSTYVLNIGKKDGERTTVGKETAGGSILNVHGANGSANIVNTDFYLHQLRAKGDVSFADSNIYLKNVDQAIFATVTLSNSIWYAENNFNSSVAVGSDSYNGNAVADAALILNSESKVYAYNLGLNNAGDYTVSLSADKSYIEVENDLYIGIGATATLTDSDVVTNTVTVNGALTLDGASKFTANTLTLGENATITIDGNAFTGGTQTIIDLNGTESLEGKVNLVNGEGLTVIYGADGDVMISDASTDKLYVNAAWADKKAGEVVGEGLVIGVNAFASSKDALTKANELGGEITVDVTGMGSDMVNGYTVKLNNAGTYTITGGTGKGADLYGVTVQNGSAKLVFDDAYFAIGKLYLPNKGTSLTVTDSIIGTTQTVYAGHKGWLTANQGSMTIDNSIVGINFNNFTDEEIKAMPRSASDVKAAVEAGTYKYWTNDYTQGNNNGPHFGTAAGVTVTDSTLSTTWISLIDRAEMSLDNSVLYYGGAVSIGTGWVDDLYKYNSNEIGWDAQVWWGDYPATSPEGFREGEVATLNITDSIVRNIGGGNGNDSAHFQVGGTVYGGGPLVGKDFAGVLNLTDSELYITMYNSNGEVMEREGDLLVVKSNGTVNMKDSKLVTSKVINEGVFTVSGEKTSTLEIATLTGNAIEVTSGGLKDSTIGGNVLVTGNAAFDGENAINGKIKVTNGAELNINDTLSGVDTFIGAGNDNEYYGIKNGKTASGSVIINGDVDVYQVNANAGGYVEVAEGATLTTSIICVENGDIEGAEAGSMEINGTVETQRFNVFGGATATVRGSVSSEQAFTSDQTLANVISVWDGGKLTIDGGEFTAAQIAHTQDRHSSVNIGSEDAALEIINDGTLNAGGDVTNAGTISIEKGDLTVGGTLTNTGSVKVSGEAVLNINKLDGVIDVADNAVITDSTIGGGTLKAAGTTGKLVGTNTIGALSVGYGVDSDVALGITGDLTVGQMTVGAQGTLNIGDADDAENRTTVTGTAGANWINNSTVNLYNADVTFKNALSMTGQITLDNSTITVSWEGQMNSGGSDGKVELKNGSKLTYTSYFYVGGYSNNQPAELVIDNSTADVTTLSSSEQAVIKMVNGDLIADSFSWNGTLTMDAASTLTVSNDAFTMGENASIVIDAAGLVGAVKVIDLNGKVSMKDNDKITFINGGENFKVTYLSDGDVVISNVDPTAIFVNAEWSNEEYMADLGEGKYFGFNAFADVDDAVAAAGAKTNVITVANGDALHVDVTTANPNGLTINMGYYGITFDAQGNLVSLESGEKLDMSVEGSEIYSKYIGENVTVNADILWQDFDAVDIDGVVNVTTVMKSNNGVMTINGNLNVSDRFVFAGDDAIIEVAADGNFNAKYLNSYRWDITGEINVAGSAEFDEIDFGGTVTIAEGGKFDVADKMKLNKLVNNGAYELIVPEAEIDTLVNNSELSVVDKLTAGTIENAVDAELSFSEGDVDADKLINKGEMSITSGNFAADSVENTGSLTATGDSVMEFGSLVNDGEVVLKDTVSLTLQSVTNNSTVTLEDFNGTLKGFVKAEDKAVTGNIKVLGNTTLADTVDTALLSVGSWDDFSDTVAEGDKLTVAEKGIVSAANLYVQGGGKLDVKGQVNVIGHYNGVDGIFANYGTTNVSGVMSVTNEASCGENQIGNADLDNSKIKLNILDGGVFNLNTTAGVTEADRAAKLNIVDGAELNILEGGTFNSDKVSVVDNNGTVNVDGTANVEGSFVNNSTGKVVVDGTANIKTLNNYGEVEVNGEYNGNDRFANGGKLTVADGTFNVRGLVNGIDANNAGSIVLTGEAVLNVVDTLSNSYNGTINMDADSLIKVNNLVNMGTLNVSVTRDGVWMIIDGAEGVTDFGSVTVNGNVQDNLLFNDEANGDLYLVNTKSDALYFNAEWSENLAVSLGANTFKDTKLNGNDVEIKDGINAVKFYNGTYSDYTVNKDVAIETLDKGKVTMNLTAAANVTVVDDTKFEMAENSTLTVSENGSVTVAAKAELVAATVVNDGAVTVDGTMTASSMTNNGTLTLNSENAVYGDFVNNGDVEIAETGKFTATGEFVNDGKFTVNVADDMEGAKLVIDLAEDREFAWNDGDITFNVAEGMNAFYDANGDVAVSNAQMDTYVFNNTWAGSELADLVDGEAGKNGFYYGINAFDNIGGMDEQHADEEGKLFAEKLTFYTGEYSNLDLAQDMIVETVNGEAATMDVTTTNELAVESKFNLNGTLSLNGADAMLDVAEDAEATFGSIVLDDAAVKESSVAGTVTVVNDADIRNMTVAADGSMTVEGTANILGNTAFNVLGEFNAHNMVIGETFAEDEEAVATTVNVSGVNGKVVSENVTVNANAVLNITGTASFTCNGIIDNDGVINVTDAKLSAEEISNIGTAAIVISGNSTVNAVVTGNGSLRLVDGAVLDGVLTAPVLYVEGSASFAENASFTGMINGRTIYVSGDKNVLDIAMDSKATLVVADGTVFTDDNLGDIAIKGEKKDVVLTVADEAFNGNTLENVMLNIVNVEGDRINVSIDLDKVLTIDGYELKNVNGVYYYEGEKGNMFVGRMEENGKYFIQLFDGTVPGASTVEDVKNIKVNDNDDYPELANVNVRMKEGNTTISVTGKKSDIVEFAVGSILKSEKGGSNTVKFGNYTDVSVNGSIESLAKLTIGNNAKVTVGAKDANGDFLPYTGNITGQNKNNAVKIGSDSTVDIAGTINLMGGKNTMAVGARSTVAVGGSVKGISALTVASGKAAANNITDLDIDGMFVAAAANNKITIGNYARFTLGAVDGVSIENGGVESATGTTISVGKESAMIVDGSVNGIAKLTAGKNAIVTFGGNIDGTEKNNAVKIGEAARFMAADIDLAGGKNSISTGKGSGFSANVVSNVQTITVGTQSTFEAESISGVNKITVSAGKAPKKDAPAIYTNVAVDGDVVMTTGKDSFKVGSYSNVAINGNLTFGDGKDTLTLGKDAQLLAGDIEGMEVFNASKGAKLIVLNGQGDDVDLDAVSGSWKNATIIDGEGLLQDVNTGMVYANERDMFEYDLTGSGKIALENFSEGMEIYYSVADANDVYGEFQLYTEGTELTAGSYRFEVSVAGEYTDKLEKKNYSFTVAELA